MPSEEVGAVVFDLLLELRDTLAGCRRGSSTTGREPDAGGSRISGPEVCCGVRGWCGLVDTEDVGYLHDAGF